MPNTQSCGPHQEDEQSRKIKISGGNKPGGSTHTSHTTFCVSVLHLSLVEDLIQHVAGYTVKF